MIERPRIELRFPSPGYTCTNIPYCMYVFMLAIQYGLGPCSYLSKGGSAFLSMFLLLLLTPFRTLG
ncbi:hypothetical protein B0T24DRAFT_325547 [Lasiosphaeria ovina]|uniref:Uncharacterized protein n=1 Tax=Lasiosphaeria ovina TaxID=92902 RepID=A0AAE0K8N3_9PEZI|nr:hypothetical protein B0T24DRAFT_325547 [Lasiosphaeria ovina]